MKNKKYLIIDSVKASFLEKGRYNASSKPRTDSIKSILNLGSDIILLKSRIKENSSSLFRIINNFGLLGQFFLHYNLWRRHTTIFMQYPYTDGIMMIVMKLLKQFGKQLVILIHDIESLRQQKVISRDKELFDNADVIIVHSNEMANELHKIGYKGKTVILGYFDYVSEIERKMEPITNDNHQVVFAGNLEKSIFLTKLHTVNTNEKLQYFLYGKENKELQMNQAMVYKGMFDSEHFESIEGNWGLVWDGKSIETCNGELGDYLRINAPFKLSLYLAAKIPVIVWVKSAMAQFVRDQHLGIIIESLDEISTCISSLTIEEKVLIQKSVERASLEVRSGERLKSAFSKALEL